MKDKLKLLFWKLYWKIFPPVTVLDQIRVKDDAKLIEFLREIYMGEEVWADFTNSFCGNCPVIDTVIVDGKVVELHPCDDLELGCPHGDAFGWWLYHSGED